jgi:phospholipid/cholesterol/gamma-HCH transport system substrate-binding protein
MSERKTAAAVGFTITFAILLLVLGLILGKGLDLFSKQTHLNVRFSNISGIEKGDPVVVRGVTSGRVEDVTLHPEYVVLRLSLRKDIPLYSDLQVVIENRELMGGKHVAVSPGKSKQTADMDRLFRGESRGDLGALFSKGESVIARVDSVLIQTSRLLKSKRIFRVMDNMEKGTDQFVRILEDNRDQLHRTISRLDRLTHRLETDSVAVRLDHFVKEMDSAVVLVKRIAQQVESKDGTVGMLLRDRSLYDQLITTFTDMDSLIADIRANPKRYIHVSVF